MFSYQILIEPMNYILQLVELLKNNCIVITKFFANSLQLKIFVSSHPGSDALTSGHKNAIQEVPNNSRRFCNQSLGFKSFAKQYIALLLHKTAHVPLSMYQPWNKSTQHWYLYRFVNSCPVAISS